VTKFPTTKSCKPKLPLAIVCSSHFLCIHLINTCWFSLVKPHTFILARVSFSRIAMAFSAQFNAIKKMQCPFLTRLSTNYVRNYGASLLKNYANQCPVASRVISNIANAQTATEGTLNNNLLPRGN
jgi:hypothetical protein